MCARETADHEGRSPDKLCEILSEQWGQLKSYSTEREHPQYRSYIPHSVKLLLAPDHTNSSKSSSGAKPDLSRFSDDIPSKDLSPEGNDLSDQSNSESEKAVIYARRSSDRDEGRSLEDQVTDLHEIADREELEVIEVIKDDGETGTNFDREGIERVAHLAKKGTIDYLLVDHISRIGRNAPETLNFIHSLAKECSVQIITHSGELDISQIKDLTEVTMRSLISHMSTQYRSRSALRSRIRNFTEERQWMSWFSIVPLGYRMDDNGWLEPEGKEVDIVHSMFDIFLKTNSYAETARKLNKQYEHKMDQSLTGYRVKNALKRGVYIGEPTISLDDADIEEGSVSVEDPALQIIGEEKFAKVQSNIEAITRKNSSESPSEDTLDVNSAIEQFGLFSVLGSSPDLKLHCPEPDCSGEMRCNGQRKLDGSVSGHNYECKTCGRQRKWPYLEELGSMKEKSDCAEHSPNEGSNQEGASA